MNLQPIPVSTVLNPILTRHGLGLKRLGRCINQKPVQHGNGRTTACADDVWEGTGFADLEGVPFKAYYCAACAASLRN